MTLTTSKLTRVAGLAAVAAGLLYIVIQPVHPTEELSTVTGSAWVIVAYLTVAFAVLALAGVSGIYLRQVKEAGLLGLVGYLMLSCMFLLTIAYSFAEAMIIPELADVAPDYVEGFLAIFNGSSSGADVGALAGVGLVAFVLYFFGGSLLGIALFRARVLARWAAAMMLFGAVGTIAVPLLPHAVARYAAVPMGLALIGLGYSLWSDGHVAGSVSSRERPSSRSDFAPAD
jgi:hypothetical protein